MLAGPLDEALENWERQMILDALRQGGGVQARAAKLLGISERSLWYRVKKLGIQVRTPPEPDGPLAQPLHDDARSKAVFPAAGLGTRFLPATKAQPKEMLPLVDKPTIQYVVEEAVASGLDEIVLVTGRNKRAIEDHFDAAFELEYYLQDRGKTEELAQIKTISELATVSYVRQKEPLGLGHAILCARTLVGDEPFGVFLGDDIIVSRHPVHAPAPRRLRALPGARRRGHAHPRDRTSAATG